MDQRIKNSLLLTLTGFGLSSLTGCSGSLQDLTSYTASMMCSKTFVTGQSEKVIRAEDLMLITNGAAGLAKLTIDTDNLTVRSQAFNVSAKAIYREGIGCTMIGQEGEQALRDQYIPPVYKEPLSDSVAWPEGKQGAIELVDFDYEGFQPHADHHFTEFTDYQVKSSSLAIAYKGQLVYEKYAEGFTSETPIYSYSLGKTIAALFSGVLVKDDVLDIHEPIYSALQLPEWKDDERGMITPHHLLTMTSGLEWDEVFDDPSSDLGAVYREENLGKFAASKPLVNMPGTNFNYSTGSTVILASVIKNLLNPQLEAESGGGLSGAYQALHDSLLGKLGMNNTVVQADASGSLGMGAKGLVSTHDLARLGQFMLQNGQWQGEQVLPENWIAYMSTPAGLSTTLGFDYGSGIWLNTALDGKAIFPSLPKDTLAGYGLRGQFIIVVPSLELVIVRTGNTMDLKSLQFIPEMDKLAGNVLEALALKNN